MYGMSYREEVKKRSASRLRTSMDITMGIFYISIGLFVMYAKSFGSIEIPALIAYLLGGMMAIGGGFRLYRGIKAILPQNSEEDTQE